MRPCLRAIGEITSLSKATLNNLSGKTREDGIKHALQGRKRNPPSKHRSNSGPPTHGPAIQSHSPLAAHVPPSSAPHPQLLQVALAHQSPAWIASDHRERTLSASSSVRNLKLNVHWGLSIRFIFLYAIKVHFSAAYNVQ